MGIFSERLSIPHNTLMDLNDVMSLNKIESSTSSNVLQYNTNGRFVSRFTIIDQTRDFLNITLFKSITIVCGIDNVS